MHQPHKMIKRTQIICLQEPTICLSMYDHFVGLALEGLISTSPYLYTYIYNLNSVKIILPEYVVCMVIENLHNW